MTKETQSRKTVLNRESRNDTWVFFVSLNGKERKKITYIDRREEKSLQHRAATYHDQAKKKKKRNSHEYVIDKSERVEKGGGNVLIFPSSTFRDKNVAMIRGAAHLFFYQWFRTTFMTNETLTNPRLDLALFFFIYLFFCLFVFHFLTLFWAYSRTYIRMYT